MTTRATTATKIGGSLATAATSNRSDIIATITGERSTNDSFAFSAATFPWIPLMVTLILLLLIIATVIVLCRYKRNYFKKCFYIGKNVETFPNEISISTDKLRVGFTGELKCEKNLCHVIEPQQREMVDNILYVPFSNEINGTEISSPKYNCSNRE